MNVTGTLWLASGNYAPSAYSLAGGTLSTGNAEYVGYDSINHSTQGSITFIQSGGSNTTSRLFVGYSQINSITNAYTGDYNLQAGTIAVTQTATISTFNSAGVFNQTGGKFTVANLVVNTLGTFTQNGGIAFVGALTNGGNISIGTGGNLTVNSAFIQTAGNTRVEGLMTLKGNGAISGGTFQVGSQGVIDITNNELAINFDSPANDPVATIAGYLATGFNAGTWTGTSGIISTTAQTQGGPALSVGYADGNTDSGTPAAPNQIVVKYTLAGDANLDGFVNFGDLVAVIQNFNKAGTDWAHGNFTYGASTNFGDLVAAIQNLNKTLTPAGSSSLSTGGSTIPLIQSTDVQLPEPSAFALATAGIIGLLNRRRRK